MAGNYQKIVCCDTINHATPILLEWTTGLKELGYFVDYLPIPQYSVLQLQEEYDLIVYAGLNSSKLNEFIKFKKKFPNTTIVGTASKWDDKNKQLKGIVDFWVCALDQYSSLQQTFKDNGFDLFMVPLAANSNIFYKESQEKIYDACFIGNLSHGYRGEDKFLYPILDNDKYNCFLGGMTYGKYNHGFIDYQKHNPIRNQTKININFHVPYQKPGNGDDRIDCNQSVFNIALSGNFQLCDHPLVLDYFKGNIILADERDWLEKFEYYINHDVEREELAYNAMIIAQQEHTWKVRMEQFMTIVENYER